MTTEEIILILNEVEGNPIPAFTSDLGSAPITSPKPPVFEKGAPSAATNKIFMNKCPLLPFHPSSLQLDVLLFLE